MSMDLIFVAILAFAFSVFTYFLEIYFIGLEKKIEFEKRRLELNKKMKKYKNDPEKTMELFDEMMKLNNEIMFDAKRIKIMFVSFIMFFFVYWIILPKIPEKTLLVIPIVNIGLNPFWTFLTLYFIFMVIQNILLTKWLVKKYGKTSIKMEEKSVL